LTEPQQPSAIGRSSHALRALGRRLRGNGPVRSVGRTVRRAMRSVRGERSSPGRPAGAGTYPAHYRVPQPPAPITAPWPDPPVIDRPMATQREPTEPAPPVHYDLALFEQLQAEYAGQDLSATAPTYDAASIAERSRKRLTTIHERIGLAGMTVLEVGCGSGLEVWHLAEHFGCDAWGIDIAARVAWPVLAGPRVHLVEGDMASGGGLASDTFDRAVSFTVWEHITRPLEAIGELHRVLKPGGLAVIRANLYRGPTASHLAREIAFPFPHLLFQDDVIAEGLGRAGRTPRGAAWVNRLTWEQYEAAFLAAGFVIRSLSFTDYPLDEAFYQRFEDVLGRYPRRDLERGFFQVTLEKPAR
jgi:SAM-dependent methyltransferase